MLKARRTPTTLGPATSQRQQVGRRLKAARVLAGGPSLRAVAAESGLSYSHLVSVEAGREPLTRTDSDDLARVLDVPASWLRDGWLPT